MNNKVQTTYSVWSAENDTQKIIEAYDRWHIDCVNYLFHDFSFVLYDTESTIHFAARDAMGTRPLYYTIKNNQFFYSDNIGSLFEQCRLDKEPDIDAIYMLLHHQSIPHDRTLYRGIKRLPPGHFMTIDQNCTVLIKRYWEPENIKINKSITEDEAKEKFLEIFSQAIFDRIDDISTTSFELSGGLDSSSIVSTVKYMYPKEKLHTVSMTFESLPKCNEINYIQSVLEKYELNSMQIKIDNLDYSYQYNLLYNYSLDPYWPILLTQTMGLYTANELKKMGIKSIVTGKGGDELMAGNPYSLADYFREFQWIQLYRELSVARSSINAVQKYILIPLLSENQKKIIKKSIHFLKLKKIDKKKFISKESFEESFEHFPKYPISLRYDINAVNDTLHSFMTDISYYHVGYQHYGIKAFHPFFDRRLIEFMLSLPSKYKYSEGVFKVLLRKAMKGILPEKVRQRKDKAEFSAVIRQQIDAIDLDELLGDTYLAKLGLIGQSEIDRLKEDYQSDKMKTVVYFWKIINMEYWYRYNFARDTLEYRGKVQNDDRV